MGRGRSSGLGKTSGRGHKGDKARTGGGPRTYFEGGQTNFFKRLRKFGFNNGKFRKVYEVVNLNKLQVWIDSGRIDPNQKITMKTMKESGLVRRIKQGVKLLADGKSFFNTKIQIEVTAVSGEARKSIENCGGNIKTVYFSPLGLRTFLKNEPQDIKIDFAAAPPSIQHRYDIPKYKIFKSY